MGGQFHISCREAEETDSLRLAVDLPSYFEKLR